MPRLDRGIQHAAACLFNHARLGVLDRPVKPGDDSECDACGYSRHTTAVSRRMSPEFCVSHALDKDKGAGKAGRRLAPEIRAR